MKNIFAMKTMYNFTVQEIEDLMPWERDVYIDLINEKQKEEKQLNGF